MKKQSDRIKDWRTRQRAEGKTSISVMLSQEARETLTLEKEKTGNSYSVIIERALQTLKKQNYRLPSHKTFRREKFLERSSQKDHLHPAVSAQDSESAGQTKILIDDLANYPNLKDIQMEQSLKKQNDLYDFKSGKGFINRLFRSSAGSLSRRKKWFQ